MNILELVFGYDFSVPAYYEAKPIKGTVFDNLQR